MVNGKIVYAVIQLMSIRAEFTFVPVLVDILKFKIYMVICEEIGVQMFSGLTMVGVFGDNLWTT